MATKLYRVIAWDPDTKREFNVGLFQAETRSDAIELAQSQANAECHQNEEYVLDAYEVADVRA